MSRWRAARAAGARQWHRIERMRKVRKLHCPHRLLRRPRRGLGDEAALRPLRSYWFSRLTVRRRFPLLPCSDGGAVKIRILILYAHAANRQPQGDRMNKKLILTGFSGMVLGVALASLGFRILTPQGVQAQAPAPEAAKGGGKGKGKQAVSTVPCGPNIEGDLGRNTAKDSRC